MAKSNWYTSEQNDSDEHITGYITSISKHFNMETDAEKNVVIIKYKYRTVYVKYGYLNCDINEIINNFVNTIHNYIDICLHVPKDLNISSVDVRKINGTRRGLLAITSKTKK